MFGSMKWASLVLMNVAMAPVGGILAMYLTHTNFSVSSGVGFLARIEPILAALDEVAAKLHATPGKVAIAWLIARPSITAPIASATSVQQLKDLVDAANLQLDPESLKTLNEASAY